MILDNCLWKRFCIVPCSHWVCQNHQDCRSTWSCHLRPCMFSDLGSDIDTHYLCNMRNIVKKNYRSLIKMLMHKQFIYLKNLPLQVRRMVLSNLYPFDLKTQYIHWAVHPVGQNSRLQFTLYTYAAVASVLLPTLEKVYNINQYTLICSVFATCTRCLQ